MKGVILSRTEMKGGRFCSNVAVKENDRWRQVRPRPSADDHLDVRHLGDFPYVQDMGWQPGRHVEFRLQNPQPYPRPTHPEDVFIEPRSILTGQAVSAERFRQIIRHFTFDSFAALYPGLRRQGNGGAYLSVPTPETAFPRSVGYVRDCRVEIMPGERITLIDASDFSLSGKIKDAATLSRLRSGDLKTGTKYKEALVRLSLAAPWARPDEDGTPCTEPRCYVMFSGFGN